VNRILLLIRHSLPEIDKDLPAREWILSEEGKARAYRLAERLIRYQPEIVTTSPEPKAMQTAEIVAGKLHLPIHVIDELHEHERSLVPYLSPTNFEAVVHKFFEKPDTLVFGSETADKAHERFSRAVYSAMARNGNSRIAIVSHGTVISLFVSRLTRQPGIQTWSELGLPGVIVLDMQSRKLIAFENIL
jgi:broad specificity phosphatase PhoE